MEGSLDVKVEMDTKEALSLPPSYAESLIQTKGREEEATGYIVEPIPTVNIETREGRTYLSRSYRGSIDTVVVIRGSDDELINSKLCYTLLGGIFVIIGVFSGLMLVSFLADGIVGPWIEETFKDRNGIRITLNIILFVLAIILCFAWSMGLGYLGMRLGRLLANRINACHIYYHKDCHKSKKCIVLVELASETWHDLIHRRILIASLEGNSKESAWLYYTVQMLLPGGPMASWTLMDCGERFFNADDKLHEINITDPKSLVNRFAEPRANGVCAILHRINNEIDYTDPTAENARTIERIILV
jgi:hypothetical protein